jgi:hypothetical protein
MERASRVVGRTRPRRTSTVGYHDIVDASEALRRSIAWERENRPGPDDPHQLVDRFDSAAENAALARLASG